MSLNFSISEAYIEGLLSKHNQHTNVLSKECSISARNIASTKLNLDDFRVLLDKLSVHYTGTKVKMCGIGKIIDALYPDFYDDVESSGISLRDLLHRNDSLFYYYTREKFNFFNWEAIKLAEAAGKEYVIMENLS